MSVLGYFDRRLWKGANHERPELELKSTHEGIDSLPAQTRTGPWVLSPYVRAGLDGGILYLGFGSLQKQITDRRRQELILSLCHFWMTAAPVEEAKQYLLKRAGANEPEAEETIVLLLNNRYLIRPEAFHSQDRFSRHALFYALAGADPRIVQEKLAKSHVVVLGCGGIGNAVACLLATAGVGRLTLIDDDTIEASNLTRQFLFGEEDIGRSKALVLKRELERRDGRLRIETVATAVRSDSDLKMIPDCDLIVLSADSGGLLPRLNLHAVKHRIPFVDIGYVQDVAVWGPFVIPGKTGCQACRQLTATQPKPGDLAWTLIKEINGRYQAPGFGPVTMAAAGHSALDILRFLGGFGEIRSLNRRVGIWTHDLHIETQDCPRNPECPVCGVPALSADPELS